MKLISAKEACKNLYNLLDEANNSHTPILIEWKRGGAVLIGEDDWRAIKETLLLTSIPGMRESIKEGLKTPLHKTSTELKW
jgi:PHD/YefM family antitoxin component YafN of YafNO toxin-antitoxin module